MNASVVSRAVAEKDFEQVYAIYMHETAIPYLGFDPMSKTEFASIFANYVRSGAFVVFEADGDIVGFVNALRQPGRSRHVVQLGPLAVKATHHGSGVAETIVQQVLADLRASGVRRVELIVEIDNPRAIRFYQRLGFEIEGTLRRCYRRSSDSHDIDSYIMALLFEDKDEGALTHSGAIG